MMATATVRHPYSGPTNAKFTITQGWRRGTLNYCEHKPPKKHERSHPAGVRLTVFDSLTVTITGSGDLHYKGSPAVHKTVVGDGYVKKVDALGNA